MAQRRMLSLEVIDTDAFLDMPQSSQLLYFHLNARADDDGFVANPKKIMRVLGSQQDDLKVLVAKKFIINFNDGVCVIKHWRINNFVRKDIYKETQYLDLKRTLFIRPSGAYTTTDDGRAIPVPDGHFQMEDVNDTLTQRQLSIGKDREDKLIPEKTSSIGKEKEKSVWRPDELPKPKRERIVPTTPSSVVDKWNAYPTWKALKRPGSPPNPSAVDKLLPTAKTTPDIQAAIIRKRTKYTEAEFNTAIENYVLDILNRKQDKSTYYTHRFTLYEFLVNKDVFEKYVNR